MNSEKALSFLRRHGMDAARIDPLACAEGFKSCMEEGLREYGALLPMIPTYLKNNGAIQPGASAIVIDAGGTNFRSGLMRYTEQGFVLERSEKCKMPGTEEPVSWEAFIRFVADRVEPYCSEADAIGFCFSYEAEITPEIDGKVVAIDKEVVVTGSEGKLVGKSLLDELERRGYGGKSCVIINDTAAVLIGQSALLDKSRFSSFIGQVSGTGTNTCCILPMNKIPKLHRQEETAILVNAESGCYDRLPRGDYDLTLDEQSHMPGQKLLEKLTAGVYLGELARLMLAGAVQEGLLSEQTQDYINSLGHFDSARLDAWAAGEEPASLPEDDAAFLQTLALQLFERSARAMCTNLLAMILLTDTGKDLPVCVCAEGSLVQKGRHYRLMLERFLREGAAKLGRKAVLNIGSETTLPGAAAAAILNR